MKCPECGKVLPDNAANCKKCGKVFKENAGNAEMEAYLKKEKEKALKLNEKKTAKKAKQSGKKPVNKKLVAIIAAVVAVIVAGIVFLLCSDVFKKDAPQPDDEPKGALSIEYTSEPESDENAVMKLGDINISYEELEFFYRQSYSNAQNNAQLTFRDYMNKKLGSDYDQSINYYNDYFSEFLKENPNTFDFTKGIDQQSTMALDSQTGKEMSWAEYILQDAIKTMTGYRVKFELAAKMGLTLTDDVRAQVYDHIEGLRTAVLDGGYDTLDQYLKILFGESCDEEFFKNELIREYMATKYDFAINKKLMAEYTDDNIRSIYDSDYKNYDYIDLYAFEVQGARAEIIANKIAKETTDLNSFSTVIKKYSGKVADRESYPAVPKGYVDGTYSKSMGDWAFDRQRKSGDKAVFKTQKGYSVAFVQTPVYSKNGCLTYREIVLPKTDSTGTSISAEEIAKLKTTANDIYNQWKNGKADEDTFMYYALTQSKGNSASTGGLVSGKVADELQPDELKKWLTDSNRKAGDTQVIETNDAVRVVYFITSYSNYWDYSIRSSKAVNDAKIQLDIAQSQNYTVSYDAFSMKKVESEYISAISKVYLGQ